MAADNFHFDITGADLLLSLQVAFSEFSTATHWSEEHLRPGIPCLVFYWHDPNKANAHPFPTRMKPEDLVEVIKGWLKSQDYGKADDCDGSVSKGWRVFNEKWGRIADNSYAFVAVEPEWLEHSK